MFTKSRLEVLLRQLAALKRKYPEDSAFYDSKISVMKQKYINYCNEIQHDSKRYRVLASQIKTLE